MRAAADQTAPSIVIRLIESGADTEVQGTGTVAVVFIGMIIVAGVLIFTRNKATTE